MKHYIHKKKQKYQNGWGDSFFDYCPGKSNLSSDALFRLQHDGVKLDITTTATLEEFEYYHAKFPNDMLALRFISCGRPQVTGLVFREVFNVFQWQVWVATFVTLLTSIVLKILFVDGGNNISVYRISTDMISYLKNFLEQDTILLNICPQAKWRIFIGLYALAHIALSHAYRNTNVYNMVKPRKPIPYDTISQLINHSFTTYARSSGISVSGALNDQLVEKNNF